MAEALINHLGAGSYKAVSAGSDPTGEVHPKSIETLRRNGIPVHEPRSKSWDEFEGENFDLVITVCDSAARQSCPIFFGKHKKLHWSTPDPAAVTGSEEDINAAFDEAFNMLRKRIESMVKSLSEYLLFFAKFDFALCRAGFAKKGRRINNDSTIKTWEADWDKFITAIPDSVFNEGKKEYPEIFKDGGPKIWGKENDDTPRFHRDTNITDKATLIYACKHIRNNLIHGEKLESDHESVERNQKLLYEAEKILMQAMSLAEQQDGHKQMREVFEDIPF